MHTFTFEFEELPLTIVKGIPAALINGCAEISYSPDGEWKIDAVCVEGYQEISREERAAGKRPWIYVPASPSLEDIIVARLRDDNEWRCLVSNAISDQLDKDYECAADNRADIINARRAEAA